MEERSEGNGYEKYWQSLVTGSVWGIVLWFRVVPDMSLQVRKSFWSRQNERYIWKYEKASEEAFGEIIGHLFFI